MADTRAPYNFVPFSSRVLRWPEDRTLPPHDVIDPALLTGEIHLTLTAETPVFVSNGGSGGENHFFKNAAGRFAIPGSSLRGAIRQNMQILGFGLVRPGEDLEDYRIFFRDIADARDSTGGPLRDYYRTVLGITTVRGKNGAAMALPRNVKAGYLRKTADGYEIQPVSGGYLRVSRRHPDVAPFQDRYAERRPVFYQATGDGQVKHLRFDTDAAPCPGGWAKGTALFTGMPVGGRVDKNGKRIVKKPNHLYIFPVPDESADPEPISREDEISYREDWEKRKNALKGFQYDVDHWALPKAGEEKPVFYIRHDGQTFFGMSLFLRIGYLHPLSHGLPAAQRELLAGLREDEVFLDYPHAIFGFARQNVSYRSRVSFGDLTVCGQAAEMAPVVTVLGEPRPSFYAGYVAEGKHYNDADLQLRGYKQYWLKPAAPAPTDKPNAASTLRPLPAGTRFQGVIRYKNLHEDELGLLLWALRLDEGCFQAIGMGKPYGYGRMRLCIDSLRRHDPKALYSSFSARPTEAESGYVDHMIDTYIAAAEAQLLPPETGDGKKKGKAKKRTLRDTRELRAFFYLRSSIRTAAETRYLELKEYKNLPAPLPDVAQIRHNDLQRGAAQPAAQSAAPGRKKLTLADLRQLSGQ